jgi:hypothetical protein
VGHVGEKLRLELAGSLDLASLGGDLGLRLGEPLVLSLEQLPLRDQIVVALLELGLLRLELLLGGAQGQGLRSSASRRGSCRLVWRICALSGRGR